MIVNAAQMGKIKVGVNLCGRDISMPQELLYGAQIATGFKHVAGKGMAQGVGMDPLSWRPGLGPSLQPGLHASGTQALPPRRKKERPPLQRLGGEALGAKTTPSDDGLPSWPAEGNAAGFLALSCDLHQPLSKIAIFHVEANQLGQPQPARVEKLEDRLIPAGQPRFALALGGQELSHNIHIEGARQAPGAPRRPHPFGGITGQVRFLNQVAKEAAQRRKGPGDAFASQASAVLRRNEGPKVVSGERGVVSGSAP